ncbi:MAG TPA: MBL fold metallo-hydrolase [Dehalococcoidia bacterium]|nr:MBL fold metallo-hydrolase [Dehalococcoidia bacterium]
MTTTFVGTETTGLYESQSAAKPFLQLLWGDRTEVLSGGPGRVKVRARGKTGYVSRDSLDGESLLEIYFIDVGQGDGVLVRTPDDRHILIDGGYRRSSLPTHRNAADFIDWKFAKDYQRNSIELDAMIASHCDADHYGALWDLIDPEETLNSTSRA